MKIEGASMNYMYVFFKDYLKKKKKCFLSALYGIYTETIQAHVFSKMLQFPVRFFTNPF